MTNKLILFLAFSMLTQAQILPDRLFFKYQKLFSNDTTKLPESFGSKFYYLQDLQSDNNLYSFYANPYYSLFLNSLWELNLSYLFINSNRKIFASDSYAYKNFKNIFAIAENAYIKYHDETFLLKFGRFVDKEGASPIDNLLISSHDYHDGLLSEIRYKNLTFIQRFYQLSTIKYNHKINRFFYQHGLRYENANLRISANEVAVTAGTHTSFDFALFNPFSLYYAQQHNDQKNLNVLVSLDFLYRFKNADIWFELLVDDVQVDSEADKANKEPNEIAFIAGIFYKHQEQSFYFNFSLIRNRTYNDPGFQDSRYPEFSFMKYIDHHQVIGYPYGSNIIKSDFLYRYSIDRNISGIILFENELKGNEAVFAPFDSVFYDYPENYFETIPYGNLKHSFSWSLITNYQFEKIPLQCIAVLNRKDKNWKFIFNLMYKLEI